jgi:hypothetical protein
LHENAHRRRGLALPQQFVAMLTNKRPPTEAASRCDGYVEGRTRSLEISNLAKDVKKILSLGRRPKPAAFY